MLYLDIVINIPINQAFTYSYIPQESDKKKYEPKVGKRAEIKFGNKKLIGFITKVYNDFPKTCAVPVEKVRPIIRVLDEEPIFNEEIYEIAKWISKYYLCSIGEAFSTILPSGKRPSEKSSFSLDTEIPNTKQNILSIEQQEAVNKITTKNNISNYHYLYGPTGTGKTEVFLQAAEILLKQGKGVIYLVPEIGLTQQVIDTVIQRFGNTTAVLHSGLTQSQKLLQWKKILNKESRIVIGARSAVFAPVPELGMIIIDEEHDASYKSGNTPRYHARQVAMFRASKLQIPLVMGSATPSVEAWLLMEQNKLIRHKLSKRLAGGKMPEINCIDLSKTNNSGCISETLEAEIRETLAQKKQAILFLNRRGFTHFFRCNLCNYELLCKNCSVSMTYHKNENKLLCHYCGWSTHAPNSCPKCGSIDIGYSGFGTEYIEQETRAKFPNAKILRLDTDSLSNSEELIEKLNEFKNGNYDIMLGTQMVAKGLNFPNLQLVGVILADTGLHLPDFRAAERTFSLITQVAGRAGRYFPDGKVFVQTYNPLREPILFACKGRIESFYNSELNMRKLLDFPPYSRLIRLVFRSSKQANAIETAHSAKKIIESFNEKNVEVIGPAECPIVKISQNFRYQILLKGKSIIPLQKVAYKLLFEYTHSQNVYIECDVDPVSML